MGSPIIIPGPGTLVVLSILLIRFMLDRRLTIVTHVVSTIAACMRQNLPLAHALEQAAGGQTDRRSVLLRRIATRLHAGAPLSEAMRLAYRRFPGWVMGMVRAGERMDQLPAVFQSLQGELVRRGKDRFRFTPVHPLYVALIVCVLALFLMGIMVFIMPKFEAIYAGYGADLPTATRVLLDVSRAMAPYAAVVLLASAVSIPLVIYLLFRARRPEDPRLWSWVGDFVKWHLPVVRWFEATRGQIQAAAMLRLSLSAGQTVDAAIANALGLDVNLCYRRRLRAWLARVESGENTAQAARQCGVGRGLAWAFEQQVGGDTPAVLDTVERIGRANGRYAASLVRHIGSPILVILLACLVGFVVYGVFLPITVIIRSAM